jgi:pantoate--beta-alanine ligase
MQQVCHIAEVRAAVAAARGAGGRIGLVPTLGNLHAGHLSLITAARDACRFVVVSVFVNPTQFGPDEDFADYPRTLETDAEACRQAGVDLLFAPSAAEMYPEGFQTYVEVEQLGEPMCGASRPGHFRGVCTVVAKLLNIVRPDAAFFGQKDAQQAAIVRRMARDLDLGVEIVVCPIVRDADGLALSSRNRYLSAAQRVEALKLSRALFAARDAVAGGQADAEAIRRQIRDALADVQEGRTDYVAVVDPQTLEDVDRVGGEVLIAAALFVGTTRLIDNVLVRPTERSTP